MHIPSPSAEVSKISHNVLARADRDLQITLRSEMVDSASRNACPISEVQTIVGTPLGR